MIDGDLKSESGFSGFPRCDVRPDLNFPERPGRIKARHPATSLAPSSDLGSHALPVSGGGCRGSLFLWDMTSSTPEILSGSTR